LDLRARRRIADRVLLFAAGQLLAEGTPSVARPDVGKTYGRRLRRSGFRLITTTPSAEDLADPSRIRVFAVIDGRASELKPTDALTRHR
jgi:hypothetical protein